LNNALNQAHIADESDLIARQQALEDLQSFGARKPPTDVASHLSDSIPGLEITEYKSNLSKQDSHVLARDGQDKPQRFSDSMNPELEWPINEQKRMPLTAIDWNSGKSPLEAWLNQSAVPSLDTRLQDIVQEEKHTQASLDQEQHDIGYLRKVHLHVDDKPLQQCYLGKDAVDPSTLPYRRKITDKFPCVPAFLVSRLAEANLHRDNRLRRLRDTNQVLETRSIPPVEPPKDLFADFPPLERTLSVISINDGCMGRKYLGSVSSRGFELLDRLSRVVNLNVPMSKERLARKPIESGGLFDSRRRRSSSVCSFNSSRNSSLRGDEDFETDYQAPAFSRGRSASHSSYDIELQSLGLPPAPT
jgi:hypothetical protein